MSSRPGNIEKLFFLLKRSPTLSMPAFTEYWLNQHGALLAALRSYRQYRSRYVQNHVIGMGPLGEAPFPFDGVTEVWVDASMADAPPFQSTDEYRFSILPDEEKMLDRKSSIIFRTTEHVIVPGEAGCKIMIFFRKPPGMTSEAFSADWRGPHAELMVGQREFASYIKGYRQNHVVPGTCTYMTGEPVPHQIAFDGVIEMWFDSPEHARRAFLTKGYLRAVRADESRVFAVEAGKGSIGCLVKAHDIFLE